VGLQIATPIVDISLGPADAILTGTATDDLSGAKQVRLNVERPSGTVGTVWAIIDTDGAFTIHFPVAQLSPLGTYDLFNLFIRDYDENSVLLDTADLQALGFPTSFEVIGDVGDTTPPDLVSLQIALRSSTSAWVQPT
jgi:hypothetical protein